MSVSSASEIIRKVFHSGIFWLGLAVAILLFAVWQSDKDRPTRVRNAQVQFCKTVTIPAAKDAVARDHDATARDEDIAIFAKAAAEVRRAEGNHKIAAIYEGVVKRAEQRKANAEARQKRAHIRASTPCEKRFPEP